MSVVFLSSCALPGLSIRDYDREPDQYATSDDPRYLDEDEVDYDPVVHSITPALVLNQQVADTIETGGPGGARHNERLDAEYKVGPGDVLSVIVWVHPDLTNPTGATENLESAGRLVQADGTIFFPFVGTINVAGHTIKEIRQMLTDGLESVMREPQVDLRVLSYRSKYAFVVGSVGRPCRIAITDRPLTIVDALNQCNSITRPITTRSVTVVRGSRTQLVGLRDVYLGDDPYGIRLHNGDRIYLNDTRDRIFMVGEFMEQKTLPVPTSGLTLAESIAASGGLNLETANAGGVYVIRGLVSERDMENEGVEATDISPEIYHLDASSIDALILADQFQLQPRDVVFAAAADLVNFNRALAQLIPTVSLLFQSRFIVQGR
ncbi:MAG: polysaccharide biosynthesis/export family protein [Gammaproteobacteria bacterium]|nr:polysaccharide biosynthesis/export family protein [Gammaproteobacteria bacterium]